MCAGELIVSELIHTLPRIDGVAVCCCQCAYDVFLAAQAIAYMKVHYAEPINLEEMAEECGLSTSYFSKKFKEQTGEKYIDVLTDIRIREAQRLLGTTDMPVAEIVEAVGYCDDKHFRRLFHKVTGMNPLEYRKKIRSGNPEIDG